MLSIWKGKEHIPAEELLPGKDYLVSSPLRS